MDARVEELSGTSVGRALRTGRERLTGTPYGRALAKVLASDRVAWWEWVALVIALAVLRPHVALFIRQRLEGALGGPPGPLWREDTFVQTMLFVVIGTVFLLALRRVSLGTLTTQPALLAFLGWVWLSTSWSIDPALTARHALLFVGTAAIGWYIGERFAPQAQVAAVVASSLIGAFATFIAGWLVPDIASRTGIAAANEGRWSGVFINRNTLGLVMSTGLIALFFLVASQPKRTWLAMFGVAFFGLGISAGSATATIALIVTACFIAFVFVARKLLSSLTPAGGAAVTLVVAGGAATAVHFYWSSILTLVGRDPTLTGRTGIWQVVQWLSARHPWLGWGFEAIWTNDRVIEQTQRANRMYKGHAVGGGWPYQAHNGYYEVMLAVGRIGLALFIVFLAIAAWRAFRYAWVRKDLLSLWPLALLIFGIVVNFSESLFNSAEGVWALTVAAAVTVHRRTDPSHLPPPPGG